MTKQKTKKPTRPPRRRYWFVSNLYANARERRWLVRELTRLHPCSWEVNSNGLLLYAQGTAVDLDALTDLICRYQKQFNNPGSWEGNFAHHYGQVLPYGNKWNFGGVAILCFRGKAYSTTALDATRALLYDDIYAKKAEQL